MHTQCGSSSTFFALTPFSPQFGGEYCPGKERESRYCNPAVSVCVCVFVCVCVCVCVCEWEWECVCVCVCVCVMFLVILLNPGMSWRR